MKLTDDIYAELNEIENKLTQKIAKDRKRKSIHNWDLKKTIYFFLAAKNQS